MFYSTDMSRTWLVVKDDKAIHRPSCMNRILLDSWCPQAAFAGSRCFLPRAHDAITGALSETLKPGEIEGGFK